MEDGYCRSDSHQGRAGSTRNISAAPGAFFCRVCFPREGALFFLELVAVHIELLAINDQADEFEFDLGFSDDVAALVIVCQADMSLGAARYDDVVIDQDRRVD